MAPKYLPLLISLASIVVSLSACGQSAKMRANEKKANLSPEAAVDMRSTAGRTATNSLSYSFMADTARQTLKLEAEPPKVISFQQTDRPVRSESFVQGHSGEDVKEDFTVSRLDRLDLLVVVDNSSSMGQYQEKLSHGMASLLSRISNTDWRMVITTTSAVRTRDPADPTKILKLYGCPRINAEDPADKAVITHEDYKKNPEIINAQFEWKVKVGETGDPIERGLLASVNGFRGECGDETKPWARSDSHKAVLILTDEENCGSDPDQNCDQDEDAHPDFFISRVPGAQFFALLHDNDRYAECSDDGYIRKPEDYRQLIARTGGIEGNICSGAYQDTLLEISKGIHPVPRTEYTLSYAPSGETIKFFVNGEEWNAQYTLQGQTLTLNSPLPGDAAILSIGYRHDPVARLNSFPLMVVADPKTIEVKVNGILAPDGSYSSDGKKIVFASEPPELARIQVAYRPAGGLLEDFELPKDALLSSLSVSLTGHPYKILGDSSYTLHFEKVPSDGVSFDVFYETEGSRTLKYAGLSHSQDRIVTMLVEDAADAKPVTFRWDGNSLSFPREEVTPGRIVNVTYTLAPSSNSLALSLAQKPLEGSLKVESSHEGQACLGKMHVESDRLLFPCPAEELGLLKITYDYLNSIETRFLIPGNLTAKASWQVKVDGKEVKDYRFEKGVLSFPSLILKADTVIEVRVLEPVVSQG